MSLKPLPHYHRGWNDLLESERLLQLRVIISQLGSKISKQNTVSIMQCSIILVAAFYSLFLLFFVLEILLNSIKYSRYKFSIKHSASISKFEMTMAWYFFFDVVWNYFTLIFFFFLRGGVWYISHSYTLTEELVYLFMVFAITELIAIPGKIQTGGEGQGVQT